MVAASDPVFEMHLVGVGGGPAYYEGASGIRQSFRDVAESWQSFRFEATDLRDLGDRVLVLGDVSGCGRGSGVEVDDRWAWIIAIGTAGLPACAGSSTNAKPSKPPGCRSRAVASAAWAKNPIPGARRRPPRRPVHLTENGTSVIVWLPLFSRASTSTLVSGALGVSASSGMPTLVTSAFRLSVTRSTGS